MTGTRKSSIAHAYRFRELQRRVGLLLWPSSWKTSRVKTTARGLAVLDSEIKRALADAFQDVSVRKPPDILPAKKLSEEMLGPIVTVIDALDESGTPIAATSP
jgi:hypothetical protein